MVYTRPRPSLIIGCCTSSIQCSSRCCSRRSCTRGCRIRLDTFAHYNQGGLQEGVVRRSLRSGSFHRTSASLALLWRSRVYLQRRRARTSGKKSAPAASHEMSSPMFVPTALVFARTPWPSAITGCVLFAADVRGDAANAKLVSYRLLGICNIFRASALDRMTSCLGRWACRIATSL
jgi:hypothetical protein